MQSDKDHARSLMRALSALEIKLSKLEQQAHINEASHEITLLARNEEIAGLKEMVKTLQAQHATALSEIDRRGERLTQLRKSFEDSTSWRITRPLRWLSERLRPSLSNNSADFSPLDPIGGAPEAPSEAPASDSVSVSPAFDDESQHLKFLGTHRRDYAAWVDQYDNAASEPAQTPSAVLQPTSKSPVFSLVSICTGPADTTAAMQTMEAVRLCLCNQSFHNWEWVLAGSTACLEPLREWAGLDDRLRLIDGVPDAASPGDALNAAVQKTTGEWIMHIDDRTRLRGHALQTAFEHLLAHPSAGALYADEDSMDRHGARMDPSFRCDLNPDLLLATDYLGQCVLLRRDDLIAIGGWDRSLHTGLRHDLVLRLTEWWPEPAKSIVHVPQILSHRLVQPDEGHNVSCVLLPCCPEVGGPQPEAGESVPAVVQAHLSRRNLKGTALSHPALAGACHVRFALPDSPPRVGIVIPTRDNVGVLSVCLESLLQQSSYPDICVVVVDNGSIKPETLAYLQAIDDPRVQVLRDDAPFNFSRLVNRGAAAVEGEVLCLLNNDMQITQPDWLEEMVGWALQDGVAAVGARLWYAEDTLQHGGIVLGIQGVAGHAHKYIAKGDPGYLNRAVLHQTMSAVTGACMVVRRTVFDQLGGFDEALGVAYNDVDFCLRARKAGYRNVWTPHAEMIHHESISRGFEDSPEKQARFQREAALMRERWADGLDSDPAYNPNLTLEHEDFGLAWPPRASIV